MNLILCIAVNTYLVSNEEQLAYISTLYPYLEIPNCYERTNEIFVNLDANQICINILPSRNEACNQLPKGVFIDIEFSNFETNFIRM